MRLDLKGRYAVVRITGDLSTEEEVAEFKSFVENAIDTGAQNVIFDFSTIKAINSSGIGKILLLYKKLRDYNGTVGFINLSDSIRDLFDKLMFFKLFKEYASEEELES